VAPTFYFSAMSPYSWLAAERIGELIPDARWRAIAGGEVHAASGRVSWGRTHARARNVAECEQRALERGLGRILWPAGWPSDGTRAARALTFADARGMLRPLALTVMRMGFLEGCELSEPDVLAAAAGRVGIDGGELLRALDSDPLQQALDTVTQQAIAIGMTGMPTVVVDGGLFWGDDRLEDAASSAARCAGRGA
jgi:2-hydroxychromene-2-carboxylate isomerase